LERFQRFKTIFDKCDIERDIKQTKTKKNNNPDTQAPHLLNDEKSEKYRSKSWTCQKVSNTTQHTKKKKRKNISPLSISSMLFSSTLKLTLSLSYFFFF